MKITQELLRAKSACADGFAWFAQRFGENAIEYQAVLDALAQDDHADWARWLLGTIGSTHDETTIDGATYHEKHLFVAGRLVIRNYLSVRGCLLVGGGIKAGWSIETGGGIRAGWIEVGGGIKAGEDIEASWGDIEAGASIKAGWSIKAAGGGIKAGWGIEAGENIKAGWIESGGGIRAGWDIEADWNIDAGGGIEAGFSIVCTELAVRFRIFAGLCSWRLPSSEEQEIRCASIKGTVAYGTVVLVPRNRLDEGMVP